MPAATAFALILACSVACAAPKENQADKKERVIQRRVPPIMPPPSVPIGPIMTNREFSQSRLHQRSIEEKPRAEKKEKNDYSE